MRMLDRYFGAMARLSAVFLCGVLLSLAWFSLPSVLIAAVYTLVAAALWAAALAATRRVRMLGTVQIVAVTAGAATAWLVLLALAASSMD